MELNQLSQELDLADVAQLMIQAINRDAEEHDALLIKLNNAELKNRELEAENETLRGIADQTKQAIDNLEKRYQETLATTKASVAKLEFTLSNLERELKQYKELFGTVKKAKERLARLKKSNEETTKRNDRLVKENRQYKEEVLSLKKGRFELQFGDSIVTAMESICWEHDGEYLLLFHRQMTRDPNATHAPALLYISPTGSASMMLLEGDEPVLSRQPRGGHKPKSETAAFAKNWLNKVKSQKGMVKADDLDALKYNVTLDQSKKAA